jgi:hypothetical protein
LQNIENLRELCRTDSALWAQTVPCFHALVTACKALQWAEYCFGTFDVVNFPTPDTPVSSYFKGNEHTTLKAANVERAHATPVDWAASTHLESQHEA